MLDRTCCKGGTCLKGNRRFIGACCWEWTWGTDERSSAITPFLKADPLSIKLFLLIMDLMDVAGMRVGTHEVRVPDGSISPRLAGRFCYYLTFDPWCRRSCSTASYLSGGCCARHLVSG